MSIHLFLLCFGACLFVYCSDANLFMCSALVPVNFGDNITSVKELQFKVATMLQTH